METTEKIVEAYVRYVKKWFTIPNIKCVGQFEIDLLAVETQSNGSINRYHIESGVSISGSYSALTNKPYSVNNLRTRTKQAGQRRTLGYFVERKFGSPEILESLQQYGFKKGNYHKVIVTWGWQSGVEKEARKHKIQLWDFRDIMREISTVSRKKTYFIDDTLRTLQLMVRAK